MQNSATENKPFLVYNASAGSGKTYTLVREFLVLALQANKGDVFRSILAITFTNKASAEMKARVLDALEKIAGNHPKTQNLATEIATQLNVPVETLPEKAATLLRSIIHQYGDFSIGTIDSFMHRVVRTFAYDLHLPVSFSVELDKDNLIKQAIDQILDLAGVDKDITDVLLGFNITRTEEEKNTDISFELGKMAEDLLDDTKSAYVNKLTHLPIRFFLDLHDQRVKSRNAFKAKAKTMSLEILALLEKHGIRPDDLNGGSTGAHNFWTKLSIDKDDKYEISKTVAKTLDADTWYPAKAKQDRREIVDSISDELSRRNTELIEFILKNRSQYFIDIEICKVVFATALLREIAIRIDQIRSEQHTLHISEFNKRVAEIVMNEPAPFVYERLGEKYAHYLIDEFQDTSITQWQNLLPLIQNGLATASKSMLVGDGKQAIYRFRGGDVEQFINMPFPYPENLSDTQLERYNLLKMHHKGVKLDTNWRSKPEIVNWNNAFYRHLSHLLSESHVSLYAELNQLPRPDREGGFVSVKFLGTTDTDAEQFKELQGEEVLRLVRELIGEKHYAPSDIAILTRKNDHGSYLANLLLENQIPVISGESLLVKGKPEVQFLIAWLRVLSNTDVKVNLLHVCGYLLQHRMIPFETLDALLAHVSMDERAVIDMLEQSGFEINAATLKAQNLAESVHNLCRIFRFEIITDSFLQFFLEAVWFSGDQTNPDIPTFLEKWSELEKKYSVVLPQNANAVKIMSVHKSKGLEFPVVILAFAANEEGRREEFIWIDDPQILPEGLPALRFKILKDLRKTNLEPYLVEEDSRKALDRINLLYVASTRPEEALYIISRVQKPSDVKDWGTFLRDYCEKFAASEENLWIWGDATHQCAKSEHQNGGNTKSEQAKSYTMGNWREKLEMASSRNASYENDAIRLGNLVHTTLSWIRRSDDYNTAMLRLRTSGLASSEEMNHVSTRIEVLLQHEKIRPLFNVFDKVYIERNLLLSDGTTLRPDRVVVQGKTTTLVEYKSGAKKPKHIEQTNQYLGVLKTMQPQTIYKAMLVYLSNPVEIIEVD